MASAELNDIDLLAVGAARLGPGPVDGGQQAHGRPGGGLLTADQPRRPRGSLHEQQRIQLVHT